MLTRVIRWTGWTLIATGVLILLYVVYLLYFTSFETNRAQQRLAERFEIDISAVEDAPAPTELPSEPVGGGEEQPAEEQAPVDPGDAYAAMWFERDGERIVHDDPLYVVEGVSLDRLRSGPGHYPHSEPPGSPGNFAVSGHRTTYGAPFYHLDRLTAGDEIHVVDRSGQRFVYAVAESRVVAPTDTWVVGDDPLGTGNPTLTLTTCHPRFSAAQRLIVFAELQTT